MNSRRCNSITSSARERNASGIVSPLNKGCEEPVDVALGADMDHIDGQPQGAAGCQQIIGN
jgi:hypothetical protein